MLGRTDSRPRLLFLLVVLLLVGALLVSRLAWWQVVHRTELAALARQQTHLRMEVDDQRGTIYDRSGTVVLATTVDRARVVAAADRIDASARAADTLVLSRILGLDQLARIELDQRLRSGRPYVVLARDVEPETAELIRSAIRDGSLSGISLEIETARVYPQAGGGPDTTLAAHLIGFVNRDGQGQYGVEQYYDDRLAGAPTIFEAEKDANGRPIADTEVIVAPGVPGADLRLTIDVGLQLAVEQEVLAAWVADRARSVSAIVIDPHSGEIYAAATYPAYDANDYRAVAVEDSTRFIDPIVASVYEPGSVFKMMTVVAALEQGTATPRQTFLDEDVLVLDGGRARVRDADRKGMGEMTLEDAIAYSRNVVAAKIALGLGPTSRDSSAILHEVWTRLGFGSSTGIDVAGEVGGLVRDPAVSAWREIDLANGSFGQGVAITPLQLATAYAAMVNGGLLVTPHVVAAIDGSPVAAEAPREVLSPDLSPTLTWMLNHVVTSVPVYAAGTLVPGYFVGGKTGTAQIWDAERATWKSNVYNFSFVGYIGRRIGQPDLIIAIRIDEARPTVKRIGRLEMPIMSYELFGRIATDAVLIPGLLPELPPAETTVPVHT